MGVEIIDDGERACFMCNTSDTAFGPIMKDKLEARNFLNELDKDPRTYSTQELKNRYFDFRNLNE